MSDPAVVAVDAGAVLPAAPLALVVDPDSDIAPAPLPADHPRWQRDTLSISARAGAAIAAIVPHVVRTLSYWDHRLREIVLGTRRLGVDNAGCYRLR